jgi:hypothetical protein
MVARAHGRAAVSLDLSFDYARLTRWRVFDSGGAGRLRASVRRSGVPRQLHLFTGPAEGLP